MKTVETPKVSVVMITKNRDNIMLYAIDTILKQTYNNFEFIILDGGSDDATADKLTKLCEMDARVKWLHFPSSNYLLAYTKIFTVCTGEYIAIMESDDLCTPNKIQAQADYLTNHKNVDVVSCTTLFNNHAGIANTINNLNNTQITGLLKEQDINVVCPFQSVMFRKSVLDKVFLGKQYYFYPEFYEGHGGDAFLYTLFYKGCKFANINNCSYIYRLGESAGSLTLTVKPQYYIDNLLGKSQRDRKKCINTLYKKYIVNE